MRNEETGPIRIVRELFDWYNEAITRGGGTVTRDDVRRFFTDDAVMITNETVKCQGIEGHFRHFEDIARKMDALEVGPFRLMVQDSERAAAYYHIRFKDKEGKTGTVLDTAFWEFRDGKIARMVEVVDFVGPRVELESY